MEKLKQTIVAASLIGEYGITLDDGRAVFRIIHPLLQQGNTVILDFQDVKLFASPFLNASIGQLFNHFSLDFIQENFIPINMSNVGENTMRQVMKNANDYYNNPLTREAVDRVLAEQCAID